jgi:putative PIN family toxin of toxin-antitoxin system
MIVVSDTNDFISAAFWPKGESRRCFYFLARRKFQHAVTPAILEEDRDLASCIRREEFPENDPKPFLDWIMEKSLHHVPAPLGKRRSKDIKDNIFLACALASGAEIIILKDHHLLNLEKPFGIQVLSPRQFLGRLQC